MRVGVLHFLLPLLLFSMLEVPPMVTIFRRKFGWLGVSVLILVAAGLVAAAVFFALRDALGIGQSTATAYITFAEPKWRPITVGGSASLSREDVFDLFKTLQEQKLKSWSVLNRALRDTPMLQFPSVWRAKDPVAWLQSRLSATFPNNGWTMAVSVRCRDARQAAILANAILDSYYHEAVMSGSEMRRAGCDPASGDITIPEEGVKLVKHAAVEADVQR
jgi:hypothetical protein